jgi:hypothetical protein
MARDLTELFKGLTTDHVKLDSQGRVVISSSELAASIEKLGVGRIASELEGNGICCGNGSCASPELTNLLTRVISGRAGG